MDEIRELLFEDTKEKHLIGRSHASRRGRGSAKTMRTAVDILSAKERRKYRGTGKVTKYIMMDTFVKWETLKELPEEELVERLTYWRGHYKNKEVAEGLGIEEWKVYDLYKKHKIPAKLVRQSKQDKKQAQNGQVEVYVPVPQFPSGTRITIDKEFTGESLIARLNQIIGFIEEGGEYSLKMIIEETA